MTKGKAVDALPRQQCHAKYPKAQRADTPVLKSAKMNNGKPRKSLVRRPINESSQNVQQQQPQQTTQKPTPQSNDESTDPGTTQPPAKANAAADAEETASKKTEA
jgi:hypothetical protein